MGFIHVRCQLGTHGISTEHTKEKYISTVNTYAQQEFKQGPERKQDFFDASGMDQDTGKNNKWQKCRYQAVQPQCHACAGSSQTFLRVEQKKYKEQESSCR